MSDGYTPGYLQKLLSGGLRKKFKRLIKLKRNRKLIEKPRHKRIMKKNIRYDPMNKGNSDIFLGASDLSDMLTCKLINDRIEQGMESLHEVINVLANRNSWKKFILTLVNEKDEFRRVDVSQSRGYLFKDSVLSFIEYNIHSTHTSVELIGDSDFIDQYKSKIFASYEVVSNEIEWVYTNDGQSIEIPLRPDRMPVEEMYPFLQGQSLQDYYDSFMASSASILLLIGPPGTGKTTFIRGLLQHCNTSAMVSYDASILEKDYVFASFIEGDKSVLVLEDADMFLKSREDGNTMMHKFLNVGDGLVTTRNKKLIFSTNLNSIKEIDPALVRPGRCYDIVSFRELSQAEAEVLAKKSGVTLHEKREKWSIADVFFEQNTNTVKPVTRKMGFV
jgi:hypothetical protein